MKEYPKPLGLFKFEPKGKPASSSVWPPELDPKLRIQRIEFTRKIAQARKQELAIMKSLGIDG